MKSQPTFYRAEDFQPEAVNVAGWVGHVHEERPRSGVVRIVEDMYPIRCGATCPVINRERAA